MAQNALPQRIHDAHNGLDYTLQGDYYIPMISFPSEERPVGKWGRMHKRYLEENKPGLYSLLLIQGKLGTYLADLNEQAEERLNVIISHMMRSEGITENLKATDQIQWVRQITTS